MAPVRQWHDSFAFICVHLRSSAAKAVFRFSASVWHIATAVPDRGAQLTFCNRKGKLQNPVWRMAAACARTVHGALPICTAAPKERGTEKSGHAVASDQTSANGS